MTALAPAADYTPPRTRVRGKRGTGDETKGSDIVKTGMGLAAVTVVLVAQIDSVSAGASAPARELSALCSTAAQIGEGALAKEIRLRCACTEYRAAHDAYETIEGWMDSVDWSDPSKYSTPQRIWLDAGYRLSDAEQEVVNHLSDDEIARLREIASVQRAVRTALEDGDWPFMGKVHDLLLELQGNANDAREAAIVHFCTRGRRAE